MVVSVVWADNSLLGSPWWFLLCGLIKKKSLQGSPWWFLLCGLIRKSPQGSPWWFLLCGLIKAFRVPDGGFCCVG